MPAIEVSGLRKAYGNLEAVRGVDFEIEEGEVLFLQMRLPRRSELLEKGPIRLTEAKVEARQFAVSANHKSERIPSCIAIIARPDATPACCRWRRRSHGRGGPW